MRHFSALLLFLILLVVHSQHVNGHMKQIVDPEFNYPEDSLLNKITDIDERLKIFTKKDTLGGYSAPRLVDVTEYLTTFKRIDAPRDKNGLIIVPLNYEPFYSFTNFRDTILFDPVMLPVVFDGKVLPRSLDYRRTKVIEKNIQETPLVDRDSIVASELYKKRMFANSHYQLIDEDETFSSKLAQLDRIAKTRKDYYVAYPEFIKSNALAYDGSAPITQMQVEHKNPFKELVTAGDVVAISAPDIEAFKIKQVHWKFNGEHSLNISQRADSYSWNPKTNDNFNVQSYHNFKAQYRKDKIRFDHLIEWRFNFQEVSLSREEKEKNPDYNSFLIGDDLLRTFNTLGLQSFLKNWAYTITLEAKTPVFYKKTQNDKNKKDRGPFSPLDVNFGIGGMEYSLKKESKKERGRGIDLKINLAPLSFNLKHVGSRQVYANNDHGVRYEDGPKKGEEGYRPRYTKTSFGSTMNANMQYNLNSYTYIRSRLKYDTSYDAVKVEHETTIEFKLNRYFSTSLYVYMKYDDSIGRAKRNDKWGYFSFNEVLSFGLSYAWK